jgi:membrane protease subunit (stomatin/prohibitin family)
MGMIQFTRNYNDLSTDRGFQFEFVCDRCGNGYQTHFEASATGTISGVAEAASSLFGGIFGGAAEVAQTVHSSAWEKAHDAAFQRAIEQARPHFHKCKRCGNWVDDDCWNAERSLCKDCAPDLQEEYSAIQTEAAMMDARQKAQSVEYTTADQFKQTVVAACPHCGASVSGGKFCPGCGKPLSAKKFCTECGKEIQAGVKFCPECGAQQG